MHGRPRNVLKKFLTLVQNLLQRSYERSKKYHSDNLCGSRFSHAQPDEPLIRTCRRAFCGSVSRGIELLSRQPARSRFSNRSDATLKIIPVLVRSLAAESCQAVGATIIYCRACELLRTARLNKWRAAAYSWPLNSDGGLLAANVLAKVAPEMFTRVNALDR
jgi:hypothetical protein